MPKLFISYRRKSWPFTHRLAEELRERLEAEIFVDFTGVDEDNFERSILRNLRASDAMLLVVSDQTFAPDRIHRDDDWVRREIREALTHDIPIVLVCVDALLPPADLPEDIAAVRGKEGVNFYPEYWQAAVERLCAFIVKIGAAKPRKAGSAATPGDETVQPRPPRKETGQKPVAGLESFNEALQLLEKGDYDRALFLLEALQEQGYQPRHADLKQLIAEVEGRQRARQEYLEIVALTRSRLTEKQARAAWYEWCRAHPQWIVELDTERLSTRLAGISRDILPPPFEWVLIPGGKVTLESGGYLKQGKTFEVGPFVMAKYPITNAQFAEFVQARGYEQRQYWAEAGWQKKEQEGWTEPRFWRDSRWNQPDHPVVGVSWYEAMAFCAWLSGKTGTRITLPTEQQWQRAAQGDDGREYPWGNEPPSEQLCNIAGWVGRTTPVTRYPAGASPYGVMDMSGNVWEWCLTGYDTGTTDPEGEEQRVLRGGSWNHYLNFARCALRLRGYPVVRGYYWGFRVCASAPS